MPLKLKSKILLVILMMLAGGCSPASRFAQPSEISLTAPTLSIYKEPADVVWFDSLGERSALSTSEKQEIAAFIFRHVFEDPITSKSSLPFTAAKPAFIFLSLSDGYSKAQVLRAFDSTINGAVSSLLEQYGQYLRDHSRPLWAKVDFVDDVQAYEQYAIAEPASLPGSLYGLAFSRASGIAVLPEVLVAETIFDSGEILRLPNLMNYQANSAKSFIFLEGLINSETVPAYRFSTSGFFYEDGEILPLYRGRRTFEKFTAADLLVSALSAEKYLIDAVREDGKFAYSYYPNADQESESYNILRHAGTIYAMADLYTQTGNPELLDAIKRAIGHLITYIHPCPVGQGTEDCVVEGGEAKLGGNALAVLALAQYMQASGDTGYLDTAQSLAKWMLSIQDDSGEFIHHIIEYPSAVPSDFISGYYPGEAVYALARLYQLDGDTRWLSASVKAAMWLAEDRLEEKDAAEIIHDHWLVLGMAELQRIDSNPVFVESSIRIAEAIAASQNLDPQYPDWFGSFYNPPRSTPAAIRTEALMAAYPIARAYASPEVADSILLAARNAIRFQLATQYHPETAMYLPNPRRCLGGFHRGLVEDEVRIDYVQHNLSGILAHYRELTGSQP